MLSAGNSDSGAGEMITREIIDYIIYAKEKGCSMQGMQDPAVESLFVLTGKY